MKYIKTTGIYGASDYIHIKVRHSNKEYQIIAEPVGLKNNMISKSFDKEYYTFYYDLCITFCEATRKSKKKQELAEEYIKKHSFEIAQKYIQLCRERGGKNIEILEN